MPFLGGGRNKPVHDCCDSDSLDHRRYGHPSLFIERCDCGGAVSRCDSGDNFEFGTFGVIAAKNVFFGGCVRVRNSVWASLSSLVGNIRQGVQALWEN